MFSGTVNSSFCGAVNILTLCWSHCFLWQLTWCRQSLSSSLWNYVTAVNLGWYTTESLPGPFLQRFPLVWHIKGTNLKAKTHQWQMLCIKKYTSISFNVQPYTGTLHYCPVFNPTVPGIKYIFPRLTFCLYISAPVAALSLCSSGSLTSLLIMDV